MSALGRVRAFGPGRCGEATHRSPLGQINTGCGLLRQTTDDNNTPAMKRQIRPAGRHDRKQGGGKLAVGQVEPGQACRGKATAYATDIHGNPTGREVFAKVSAWEWPKPSKPMAAWGN